MAFATRLPCVLAAPRACGPGERRSVLATAASPAASAPLPARRAACLRGGALASTACAQRSRASGCRGRRAASGACFVRAAAVADAAAPPALPTPRLAALAAEFAALPEGPERYKLLLQYAAALPALPPAARSLENRVMGCTSQTWLTADLGPDGAVRIAADSDSAVTRGFAALLVDGLRGATVAQLSQLDPAIAGAFGLGPAVLPRSRANGFGSLVAALRARAAALALPGVELRPFPSLLVSRAGIVPQGAYAVQQARFLAPDAGAVARLAAVLRQKQIGIVAHFYMDAEVQGVLTAAKALWPHIHISDSLVMADSSVGMVQAGCKAIAVLGVDFMSENVRAILDDAGLNAVPVYRLSDQAIGCTLAEAAEDAKYYSWLDSAAEVPSSLHVVYINTSLRTKALADARVPTITCTSSNVVNTVLTAAAQLPDVNVWYGPDAYMGANLRALLRRLAVAPDADVAAVHPGHTAASVAAFLPRLRHYKDGACAVHELFGADVTAAVARGYSDAFLTAHFEVPGEMFELAMEARTRGMGVVGSTQNILDFILARTDEALQREQPAERLRFVLGTETGMVTSIVDALQRRLAAAPASGPAVEVEIVFPVAVDAVAPTGNAVAATGAKGPLSSIAQLVIVPGPASGEGCSTAGGCASCPYMKMNSLSALMTVAERVGTPGEALLEAYKPKAYEDAAPRGGSLAAAGCVPILHMRDFQASKRLSDKLLKDITTRNAKK